MNCPDCEGTGKQMERKILLTYSIDKANKDGGDTTELKERVKDSLFPGGTSKDGKELSPSTLYKRVCVLYGIEPGTDLSGFDVDLVGDLETGVFEELVLLVDGYKVFDIRRYEGPGDE